MNNTELKQLADAKFDFATAKINLKERVESELTVPHNGGMFKASPSLIMFLSTFKPEIIEDEYNNPIKINSDELLTQLTEAYNYAMNAWYTDFEKQKRVRKISQL